MAAVPPSAQPNPYPSKKTANAVIESGRVIPFPPPPVPARTRGKCMTRRTGQNPKVRIGKRATEQKYFFFQYWVDVPGKEERERRTEVVGLVGAIDEE